MLNSKCVCIIWDIAKMIGTTFHFYKLPGKTHTLNNKSLGHKVKRKKNTFVLAKIYFFIKKHFYKIYMLRLCYLLIYIRN